MSKTKSPKDPLINKIADDRVFEMQRRLLQTPAQTLPADARQQGYVGPSGPEILIGISASEWGLIKGSIVRGLNIEKQKLQREMDRELNGLPGLFDAIEEAESEMV